MSTQILSPIRKSDISIGIPLPWPVYDRDRRLLLREGFVVGSWRQVERLLEAGLFRMAERGANNGRSDDSASGDALSRAPEISHTAFKDARIAVGSVIQLQLADNPTAERIPVKLIGYLEKQGLIVSHPTTGGQLAFIRDGTSFRGNVLSGKTAYTFDASVVKTSLVPFPQLYLTYPLSLQSNVIRKSSRISIELISTVAPAHGGAPVTCSIRDLSLSGAMVYSTKLEAALGDDVVIAFRLTLDETPMLFEIDSTVRNIQPTGEGDRPGLRYGLEFSHLGSTQQRALELYIYRQLMQEI
jgi:c-di-GMP-binding flagellar brake protein YcgR